MAINRYMKPAHQPLLDTYVPLPFKEMSMAYASKQKEHDDAEELAASLDDDILKVRASTPLHSKVLTQIRTDLDTELSDLVDKNRGRYADMVPELTKIQKRIAQDFQNGDLGAIKRSTKAYEKKLLKAKAEAEEEGSYSKEFSPVMGAEGAWNYFYTPGYDKDSKSWTFTDDNTAGGYQILGDGRKVLKTYEYTGLHRGAEKLKEANTLTFDKLKPDIQAITVENKKSGRVWSEEQKRITLNKIYRAAHNDKDYYSDDFKNELTYIMDNTSDKWLLKSAKSAIENIFGPDDSPEKTKELAKLQKDGVPTKEAKDWAKTSYVGIMGEKYLMSDLMTSDTWDASSKQDKFGIPRADWVPNIEGDTPLIQAGRPLTMAGDKPIAETNQPISEYIKVVNNNKDLYDKAVQDYEALEASGTMDEEMKNELQETLNTAEYNYKSANLAIQNLGQQAALQLGAIKLPDGTIEYTDISTGNRVQVKQRIVDNAMITYLSSGGVDLISDEATWDGWNSIKYGEDGLPVSIQNAASDVTDWNAQDANLGFFSKYLNTHGPNESPLFAKMNFLQENFQGGEDGGYFGGRTQSLPTFNTTTSKLMDASIFSNLVTTIGEEDFAFETTAASQNELGLDGEVTLSNLVEGGVVDKDIIENLDKYVQKALWTAVPDPNTANYKGILSLPTTGRAAANDATITLFFDAPKEVGQTWSRQGEFEEVDPDDGSVRVVTRPRTAPERMLFHDTKLAQLDQQRAITVPGDVAMSSFEDGEGDPLGFYYFNQTPTGVPITLEQYVFQPKAGLVKSIDLETGDYIYTTGDEEFNADSDLTEISQLIALNDPTQSASKAFWQNQVNDNASNEYPIALEGIPTNETSEARAMDVNGNPYITQLGPGQTILPDDRFTGPSRYDIGDDAYDASISGRSSAYIGLQKPVAKIIMKANFDYTGDMHDSVENKLTTFFDANPDIKVEYSDGESKSFTETGDWTTHPMSGVSDSNGLVGQYFETPIISGARTYQQQKDMYDDWVAGGEKGAPVANPAVGGFHVMGQAIDLSNDKNMYDWVLAAPDNVTSIGGVSPQTITIMNDGEATQVRGYKLSDLEIGGKKVMPNFIKHSLNSLFNRLNSEDPKYAKPGSGETQASFTQYPQEWWHWSFGEFKEKKPAVYPSWAQ